MRASRGANVWFCAIRSLEPVEVPLEIYQFVMAMRSARASLALAPEQPGWWRCGWRRISNAKRVLELDVTSEVHAATADLTRPLNFPRSIYFCRERSDLCTRSWL